MSADDTEKGLNSLVDATFDPFDSPYIIGSSGDKEGLMSITFVSDKTGKRWDVGVDGLVLKITEHQDIEPKDGVPTVHPDVVRKVLEDSPQLRLSLKRAIRETAEKCLGYMKELSIYPDAGEGYCELAPKLIEEFELDEESLDLPR